MLRRNHYPATTSAIKFTEGSSAIAGTFFLKIAAMPTASGYVQIDETRTYAANVGPESNAIIANGAINSQGAKRITHMKNRAVIAFFTAQFLSHGLRVLHLPSAKENPLIAKRS